jgi:hypothetical protein
MRTGPLSRAAFLAACLGAAAASAAELGTLFTTPDERDRLDRIRRGEAAAPGTNSQAARTPSVTGFVKRSDGRNTVWIDGVAIAVGQRDAKRLLEPQALRPSKPAAPEALRIERNTPR